MGGISPTGIFEEAVGYPYFYSLRVAFGGEHPWIPQAQITTLIDAVIQWGLSAVGYPQDSLLPRIDLFSLVAALTAGACTLFAVTWASVNLRCTGCIQAIVACALILFSSPPQILAGVPLWTLQPAYYVWVVPLSFLCLGMVARPRANGERHENRLILWAAVLAGVAAGIKINFLVFPLSVILAKISRGTVVAVIAAPFIALSTFLFILESYYHFSWGLVRQHLDTLETFILIQRQTMAGVTSVWTGGTSDFVLAIVFLLPIVTIGVAAITRRWEPVAVGLGGLASVGVATQRLYPHTLVETFAFAVLEIGVVTWAIGQRWNLRGSRIFSGAALVVLLGSAVLFWTRTELQFSGLRNFAMINAASARWRLALEQSGKPILILTTGNEFHPNSVESALCKGGTDITNAVWGSSPYVAGLFPRFHCATLKTTVPSPDDMAVGFVRRFEETPAGAQRRVEDFFLISLAGHACHEIPSPELVLVYCIPRAAT